MTGVLTRVGRSLIVLFLVSVFAFLALRLTPGDPALLLMGPQAGREGNVERLENLRAEMGLDQPLIVQYGIWAGDLIRGDFGESNRSSQPVLATVLGRAPATIALIAVALVIALPVSFVIGIVAARYRNGLLDRLIRGSTTLALAVPSFWLGILLLLFFSVWLGWLPSSSYVPIEEGVVPFMRHIILPAFTLATYLIGVLTRFVYTEMSDVLQEDYVRTAVAMGLRPRWILFGYAARNALLPAITVVGIEMSALIGNAVLVEQVFGFSGLGQLVFQAVLNRDYQLVQGAVVVLTVAVLVIQLVADLLHRSVDPRVKL